mmetsp:Transcript_25117/g.66765  ORF Transcript_25117/g.66765 Transcript_25117/m.66765 type:complete len:131 (+) Transcript_25117:215-607(+)
MLSGLRTLNGAKVGSSGCTITVVSLKTWLRVIIRDLEPPLHPLAMRIVDDWISSFRFNGAGRFECCFEISTVGYDTGMTFSWTNRAKPPRSNECLSSITNSQLCQGVRTYRGDSCECRGLRSCSTGCPGT